MTPSWLETLDLRLRVAGNRVCLGIDPVPERIPCVGSDACKVDWFCFQLVEAMESRGIFPAVAKPNSAFFEQLGGVGLEILTSLTARLHQLGIPVILDAKRGDIDSTAKAYAKAVFQVVGADAVTVNPWMGYDSISPFLDYCTQGKGVYLLLRTSNPGASDFQDLPCQDGPLYMMVAQKILQWYRPGLGAVVGATRLGEFVELNRWFEEKGVLLPFLIPGLGTQGGDEKAVAAECLRQQSWLHVVSSSSAILYAHEKPGAPSFPEASMEALAAICHRFSTWV